MDICHEDEESSICELFYRISYVSVRAVPFLLQYLHVADSVFLLQMGYLDGFHPLKCNICGLPIAGSPQQWMNEYRAVYVRRTRSEDPAVSGVGWAESYYLASVPASSSNRYDDPHVDPSSFVYVSLLRPELRMGTAWEGGHGDFLFTTPAGKS